MELKKTLASTKIKYLGMKKNKQTTVTTGFCCKKVETKDELKKTIDETREKIKQYFAGIEKRTENPEIFNGLAFVTFKDGIEYGAYSSLFPNTAIGHFFARLHYVFAHYLFCCYSDRKKKNLSRAITFRVKKAPEPQDVIWENLQYTSSEVFWRTIGVYTLSFLIILVSLGIVLALNFAQSYAQQHNWLTTIYLKYGLSIAISISISIINYIITYVLEKLTQ